MQKSSPDTNILIYGIVGSENNYQEELSKDYLDLRLDDSHRQLVLQDVISEYRRVLKKQVGRMRPLLRVASSTGSFEKAEDRCSLNNVHENFWNEVKRLYNPENVQKDVSNFKRGKISQMQRRVNNMTIIEDECVLDQEKLSMIETEINEEKNVKTDAIILYKALLLSEDHEEVILVSEDGDIRNCNLKELKDIIGAGKCGNMSIQGLRTFF